MVLYVEEHIYNPLATSQAPNVYLRRVTLYK